MDRLSGIGVLDKAMSVLEAVRRRPCTLSELQQQTGLPRATAHRLALALEVHGVVRRDLAGRFCLGFELLALGRDAAGGFPIAERARPWLDRLAVDTGESVQLFVAEGPQHRRCVVSVQSAHGLRWIVPEGALLPLAVGSAGRVLSGAEPTRGGWIASVEEREVGVASVSAPVTTLDANVVAAVSVSGPVERLTRQPGRRFGAQVVATARQVAHSLVAL
jgi:DNA-binding IclR family transcriptional regulator